MSYAHELLLQAGPTSVHVSAAVFAGRLPDAIADSTAVAALPLLLLLLPLLQLLPLPMHLSGFAGFAAEQDSAAPPATTRCPLVVTNCTVSASLLLLLLLLLL
jgi:hypothetical protein